MVARSVEIYLEALSFLRKRAALIGVDSFSSDYKSINLLSFTLVFNTVTFTMITIYSCFVFFDDLEKLIFCLVTYGFAIQVRFCLKKTFFCSTTLDIFTGCSEIAFVLALQRKTPRAQWKNHQIT